MKVWVITIGEPVPAGPAANDRLHRTGAFASYLSRQGHDVLWWTSAFDHFQKKFIAEKDQEVRLDEHLRIALFRGCGYRSNISAGRFLDQIMLAGKIAAGMKSRGERPDLIVCAVPPVELAAAAVKYGREAGVPVLLDLRDMWPDIFVDHAPCAFRGAARLILAPLFRQAENTFGAAAGIMGITREFVEWGIRKAGRARLPFDADFPFAYATVPPRDELLSKAGGFWEKLGVRAEDGVFRVCFFGALSRQFDIPAAIRASDILRRRGLKAQFVVCGDGDRLADFRRLAKNDPDILFPGWVDAAAIHTLMRRSSAGLAPLPDRYDYLATINNKAVEYLSAGLPVISCPAKGTLFEFLAANKCGRSFMYGDAAGLADIIEDLMRQPSKLKEMSCNAAAAFANNFTAEKVYGRMMAHLAMVAGAHRAG